MPKIKVGDVEVEVGLSGTNLKTKKIAIKDIMPGDMFVEGDRVRWTCIAPMVWNAGRANLSVMYSDTGTGIRQYPDANHVIDIHRP